MTTGGIWLALGTYLLIGLAFLAIIEATTGRMYKQIDGAAQDIQTKLANMGQLTGRTAAIIITLFALWVLWPVALYGVIESWLKSNNNKEGQS